MLTPKSFQRIYLYRPYVDFRKGIQGLAALVQDQMELSPFENALFLFTSRKRDRVKALYWDRTGFVLWYKVLEREKYLWPVHAEQQTVSVEREELLDFLKGLDPFRPPHQELHFENV